jgi:4'-phosphopantetheinyl transferase EntD
VEFREEKDQPEIWSFFINRSKIGVAPITKDSATLLSQLAHADRYLPFIASMTEKRKCEWLTVRALLKTLSGEEKEISYLPNGKPFLSDHSYHISVSHTGCRAADHACNGKPSGYAAMVLNKEKQVAIDIETISPRILKIKDRFLNREETGAIAADAEIVHLLLHWSAKESVFKILDAENVDFQSKIHIRPFRPAIGAWDSFEACETRTEKQTVFRVHYFAGEHYVLTGIF